MAFIKRIFRNLKSDINRSQSKNEQSSEAVFYSKLFVENEQWNKPLPNSDEQLRWSGIQNFLPKITLNKNLRILDLGCGRGWLTNLLSSYGTVKGVEPVAEVVNYAKKLFPLLDISVGKSDTLLQNGYQGKFDLIITSEVIEHVPQQEKQHFIYKINLLLKENGFVILSTPRKEAQNLYCKYLNLSQPIEEWLNETEVRNLFLQNSFTLIDFSRLKKIVGDSVIPIEIYQLWLFKKNK